MLFFMKRIPKMIRRIFESVLFFPEHVLIFLLFFIGL